MFQEIIGTWVKLLFPPLNLSRSVSFIFIYFIQENVYNCTKLKQISILECFFKFQILFQIVFEGVVGRNSLGNIAIDDISIAPGVCPTAPQVLLLKIFLLNYPSFKSAIFQISHVSN